MRRSLPVPAYLFFGKTRWKDRDFFVAVACLLMLLLLLLSLPLLMLMLLLLLYDDGDRRGWVVRDWVCPVSVDGGISESMFFFLLHIALGLVP